MTYESFLEKYSYMNIETVVCCKGALIYKLEDRIDIDPNWSGGNIVSLLLIIDGMFFDCMVDSSDGAVKLYKTEGSDDPVKEIVAKRVNQAENFMEDIGDYKKYIYDEIEIGNGDIEDMMEMVTNRHMELIGTRKAMLDRQETTKYVKTV